MVKQYNVYINRYILIRSKFKTKWKRIKMKKKVSVHIGLSNQSSA